MLDLHDHVQAFVNRWGPDGAHEHHAFLGDLRDLLEAYGAAALKHESLPDTEHEHGDPA